MTHLSPHKTKALRIGKQAQGMLAKVISMIEEDAYCPEIIQQAESVCGFLQSLKRELLAGHLDTCLMKHMRENKAEAMKEMLKIYNLAEKK